MNWINCNDRMPTKEDQYLVTGWALGDPKFGRYYVVAELKHTYFYYDGAPLELYTHWMQLPDAPDSANQWRNEMTPEEATKLLPIVQAISEGKVS